MNNIEALAAFKSAMDHGTNLVDYGNRVVDGDNVKAFAAALSALVDSAQDAGVRFAAADPDTEHLLALRGASRVVFIKCANVQDAARAYGTLLGAVAALHKAGVRFNVKATPATQPEVRLALEMPDALDVRIVAAPATVATHEIVRDEFGTITASRVVTTPIQ